MVALALTTLAGGLAAEDPAGWDQHWMLRGVGLGLREPAGPPVTEDCDALGQASMRDYGGGDLGAGFRIEWNLLATAQAGTAALSPTAQPLGRSAVLERRAYSQGGEQVDAEVDQLNLRWQSPRLTLVAGRQPVNLGEDFYFSPLDLFQPFLPQDNYRDFRAGVDALRATLNTGAFTQVEAVAVAGYAPLAQGGNATQAALWLDGPQGQGSLLLRARSGGDAWAFSALGGRFATAGVGGGALQLEGLGSSWTLEGLYGHALNSAPGLTQDSGQATLGWTRQWDPWLDSRVELSQAMVSVAAPGGGSFSVQRYGAASATLQASPLWTLAPALLWYGDSGQAVALLDAGWSASENGTLHLILSLPLLFTRGGPGDPPTQTQRQPSALSVDYRLVL